MPGPGRARRTSRHCRSAGRSRTVPPTTRSRTYSASVHAAQYLMWELAHRSREPAGARTRQHARPPFRGPQVLSCQWRRPGRPRSTGAERTVASPPRQRTAAACGYRTRHHAARARNSSERPGSTRRCWPGPAATGRTPPARSPGPPPGSPAPAPARSSSESNTHNGQDDISRDAFMQVRHNGSPRRASAPVRHDGQARTVGTSRLPPARESIRVGYAAMVGRATRMQSTMLRDVALTQFA